MIERGIQFRRFRFQYSLRHFNSGAPEQSESFPFMTRVRIDGAHDNPGSAGTDDRFSARRRAAMCGTRFQRRVQCCAVRIHAIQRFDLGMRQACAPMPATADDCSAFHEHCADHWIWRSLAVSPPRESQRLSHVVDVFDLGTAGFRKRDATSRRR